MWRLWCFLLLLLRTNLCLQISHEVFFGRIVCFLIKCSLYTGGWFICAVNNQDVVQLFEVITDKTDIYICIYIYIHVNEYLYMYRLV